MTHYINSEDGDMRMRERGYREKVERKGGVEDDGGLDTRMGGTAEEREGGREEKTEEEREGGRKRGLADFSVYACVCESLYVYVYICVFIYVCLP